MESVFSKTDAERAEAELLLGSRKFARTNNLGRFLAFVCDKYFEGSTSEVKEYSIAVEALGRPPVFDPQVDCIVRVTAHNLRKQLELYYATEGSAHAIHIYLPPGHYVPQFIHHEELRSLQRKSDGLRASLLNGSPPDRDSVANAPTAVEPTQNLAVEASPLKAASKRSTWTAITAGVLISLVLLFAFVYLQRTKKPAKPQSQPDSTPTAGAVASGVEIHALIGGDRETYVDKTGFVWEPDKHCAGGTSFSVTGHTIQGTDDSALFLSGRRGVFHCQYAVPRGVYEVHLLFAETAGLQEASRNVAYSVNGGPPSIGQA